MLGRRIVAPVLGVLLLLVLATITVCVKPFDPASRVDRVLIPEATAAGTKWTWVQLKWADGKDTTLVGDEADTNRTVRLPENIAWEEVARVQSTAGGSMTAIEVRVEGPRVNAAQESLYAVVEPCTPGVCARSSFAIGTVAAVALTPFGAGSTALSANYTWSAGPTATTPYTLGTPPCVAFMGRILIDADTDQGVATHWLRNARLNIVGDVGGTTPALNCARVYVYVPLRAQP
jgi:hypothetical protein